MPIPIAIVTITITTTKSITVAATETIKIINNNQHTTNKTKKKIMGVYSKASRRKTPGPLTVELSRQTARLLRFPLEEPRIPAQARLPRLSHQRCWRSGGLGFRVLGLSARSGSGLVVVPKQAESNGLGSSSIQPTVRSQPPATSP